MVNKAQHYGKIFRLMLMVTAVGCSNHPEAERPSKRTTNDIKGIHATGLKEPTPEERVALEKMAIDTVEVRPNKLGLERINAERAKQGLPPLDIAPAPDGQEVVPRTAR